MTHEQTVEQALGRYHLPPGTTARLISISENEMYQLTAPGGRQWALRLQRPGYQSPQSLASEVAWLLALRQEKVAAVPVPCAGRDGAWVQRLADPSTGTWRNVVLFLWEEGMPPTIEMDLRPCLRTLGTLMARMHAHSRTWTLPAGFSRPRWDVETMLGEKGHWGRWQDGVGMDAGRVDLFRRVVALMRHRLAVFGDGPERFGLVHGDLRLANLLLHAGELKIIDFDDCGFNWFMADVANVFSFYEHLPQVPQLIATVLDGYRTVAALTQAEEDEIPTFLMLRRLLLIAWIGSHQNAPLAASLGRQFTNQSVALAEAYLERYADRGV